MSEWKIYLKIYNIYCFLLTISHTAFEVFFTASKIRVNWFLCLFKHRVMKTYWGSGDIAPCILDLYTRWGEWSTACSSHFTRRERAPSTHWIRGWGAPDPVWYTVVKRKIPSPCQESNPRTPIIQPVS
jgi:hypothetical protein